MCHPAHGPPRADDQNGSLPPRPSRPTKAPDCERATASAPPPTCPSPPRDPVAFISSPLDHLSLKSPSQPWSSPSPRRSANRSNSSILTTSSRPPPLLRVVRSSSSVDSSRSSSFPTAVHMSPPSSSASSSDLEPDAEQDATAPSSSRKVAATLELFRETDQSASRSLKEESRSASTPLPSTVEEVEETQFVKRAEWPDRENAAIRRDRSAVTLDRARLVTKEDGVAGRKASKPSAELSGTPTRGRDIEKSFERRRQRRPSPSTTRIPSSPSVSTQSTIQTRGHEQVLSEQASFSEEYSSLLSFSLSESDHESDLNTMDEEGSELSESAFSTASSSTRFTSVRTPPTVEHHHTVPRGRILNPADLPDDTEPDMDDFDVFNWHESQVPRLPHVPLRPFRNQVGGHSAIYKFTRRAVCKPLVSRENLFYEAVEREAPPLLGYIPRYLGVMLVNYRRVRKVSAHHPNPLSSSTTRPKPLTLKTAANKAVQTASQYKDEDPNTSHNAGTVAESERPEVLLDWNKHIVPQWMLRGRQQSSSRSRIHSLQRPELSATASSPELGFSRDRAMPRPRNPMIGLSDDEGVLSARSPPHYSRQHSHSMSLCGGRGSTMVNTRLKDHVFGAIFRRLRKRSDRAAKTEDEADVGDLMSSQSGARLKARAGNARNAAIRQLNDEAKVLRRVQSAGHLAECHDIQVSGNNAKGIASDSYFFSNFKESNVTFVQSNGGKTGTLDSLDIPVMGNNHDSLAVNAASRETSPHVSRQEHFILMEDLTGRLKNPCVLDIKMGTRQYGIDATNQKKKSQRKKCDHTTSRSLGLRHCGMQLWQHSTRTYVNQDKYFGREIPSENFKSVLATFLNDGEKMLIHHIPELLQKIYGLARIIYRLKGYRFYGCSLLFIYEGDRDVQDAYRRNHIDPIIRRSKRAESLDRQSSRDHSAKVDLPSLRRAHSEDLLVGPVVKRAPSARRNKRGEVMLRIVDFAHTTTGHDYLLYPNSPRPNFGQTLTSGKGYQADVDHESGLIYARFPPHHPEQPDLGFLFGLRNLAHILETLWNEERTRRLSVSRFRPSAHSEPLGTLPTYGKDIFDLIFGSEDHVDETDPGMIST